MENPWKLLPSLFQSQYLVAGPRDLKSGIIFIGLERVRLFVRSVWKLWEVAVPWGLLTWKGTWKMSMVTKSEMWTRKGIRKWKTLRKFSLNNLFEKWVLFYFSTFSVSKIRKGPCKTSGVWNFFDRVHGSISNEAICHLCGKIIRGSTSTLRRHLKSIHNQTNILWMSHWTLCCLNNLWQYIEFDGTHSLSQFNTPFLLLAVAYKQE